MGNEISNENNNINVNDVEEQIKYLSPSELQALKYKLNIKTKQNERPSNPIPIPKNNIPIKKETINHPSLKGIDSYNNMVNQDYNQQVKTFKTLQSHLPNVSQIQIQKMYQTNQLKMQDQNNPFLSIQQNPYLKPNQQVAHPAFPDPYKEQQMLEQMHKENESMYLQQNQPYEEEQNRLQQEKMRKMKEIEEIKQREIKKKEQKEELKKLYKLQKMKEIASMPKFTKEEISALKIFKLSENYTVDELKNEYRKLALETHPDKGGDKSLFFIVTNAYKTLLKSVKKRTKQNTFLDLKNSFLEFEEQRIPTKNVEFENNNENSDFERKRQILLNSGGGGFNVNKFNQIYSDNKLEDETEEGYEKWIVENQPEETTDNPKILKKFTKRTFHNRFEKEKDKITGTQIIKYEDPKPMAISNKLKFQELGGKRPNDFSKTTNINSLGTIGFTDYKKAHSNNLLINPKIVKTRQNFKSVRDFKEKREKISYKMSDKDKAYYEKKKKLEQIHEMDRLQRLQERDIKIKQHFDKVNKLMLGN